MRWQEIYTALAPFFVVLFSLCIIYGIVIGGCMIIDQKAREREKRERDRGR